MNDKKNMTIIYLIGAIILIIATCVGTYAFFKSQEDGTKTGSVKANYKQVEEFKLNINGDLNLESSAESLPENGSNLVKEAVASVSLKANDSGKPATRNYYIYLRVNSNSFIYTKENTPEIVLNIKKPDGTFVTNIDGLNYNEASGFDLTEVSPGVYLIASDTITTSDSDNFLNKSWTLNLTYLNLNFDQSANFGHEMSIDVLLKKEAIGG